MMIPATFPRLSEPAVIPVPQTAARPRGWTVYLAGRIIGWVRRAESCDPLYARPPGTFWAIPREGLGDARNYATAADAGRAIASGPRLSESPFSLRELDGHDLGDEEASCEVTGCDDYAAHALTRNGTGRCPSGPAIAAWICERHAERAGELRECPTCGGVTLGPCRDDH